MGMFASNYYFHYSDLFSDYFSVSLIVWFAEIQTYGPISKEQPTVCLKNY